MMHFNAIQRSILGALLALSGSAFAAEEQPGTGYSTEFAAPAAAADPSPSYLLVSELQPNSISSTVLSPAPTIDLSFGMSDAQICSDIESCELQGQLSDPNQKLQIGARWQAGSAVAFSLGYQQSRALTPLPGSDLSAAIGDGENVSLTCELVTEAWGELELGLRYSRWQSASLQSEISDPARAAELGLGWRWGAFRGDVTTRYLEADHGQAGVPASMLDVNFAWQTPWNASLSVGARNVLNSRSNDAIDAQTDDLLGRVPYVRYHQDL